MNTPTFFREQELRRQGYVRIVGVDEAGRGAWAGPIVAAAVILPENIIEANLDIRDSKKLSAKKRTQLAREIKKIATLYNVTLIHSEHIDKGGIQKANIQVIEKASEKLQPDYILIDGLRATFSTDCPHELITKGDAKVLSIAAASILAKTYRDAIMVEYHKAYPRYLFHEHKGYGTEKHRELLQKYGACPIHRTSFAPIQDI